MNYAQAVVLAIVEGLTEFLPVSSTGHMIIASSVMGIAQESYPRPSPWPFSSARSCRWCCCIGKSSCRRGSDWAGMIRFYRRLIIAFIPR